MNSVMKFRSFFLLRSFLGSCFFLQHVSFGLSSNITSMEQLNVTTSTLPDSSSMLNNENNPSNSSTNTPSMETSNTSLAPETSTSSTPEENTTSTPEMGSGSDNMFTDDLGSGDTNNITTVTSNTSSTTLPATTLPPPSTSEVPTTTSSPTTTETSTSTSEITTESTTTLITSTGSTSDSPTSDTSSDTVPSSTDGTTSDSPISPSSASSPLVGVIVGCVMVILLIILLALAVLIIYCCYARYCSQGYFAIKKSHDVELEEFGNGKYINIQELFTHLENENLVKVNLAGLAKHIGELTDEDGYLAEEEYNDAREMDPEPNTHCASLSCNESKNRYINILARDDTRVILKSGKGSDYINANYIEGFHREREYIACQGPLPDTVIDFWRMVWEQKSAFIIMVTNPNENGTVKCESYWPALASMQYGNFVVKVESETLYPEFIVRQFTVILVSSKSRKEEGRRMVTQYHFTAWPDFGVPQDPSSMLKFVRVIRSHMSRLEDNGPMVVHCSAGVGRTGTFIAIDILMQKVEEGRKNGTLEDLTFSVQEIVCRMRAQRGNMVQTSAQYLFIYNSLLRVFTHGKTHIKQEDLKEHIAKLTKPISEGSDKTWLDKEYDHVADVMIPTDHFFAVAGEDYNEFKNRNMENLPFDHNRVQLEGKENDEEDYINASYIDGYYNRVEFICAEHPLPHTKLQFWTMLVERAIDVLVVFGPVQDPEDRYWPEEKEILRLGDDLTIVGEEVETEDEELEEKGREGDTEDEKQNKIKDLLKEEENVKSNVSPGKIRNDGASGNDEDDSSDDERVDMKALLITKTTSEEKPQNNQITVEVISELKDTEANSKLTPAEDATKESIKEAGAKPSENITEEAVKASTGQEQSEKKETSSKEEIKHEESISENKKKDQESANENDMKQKDKKKVENPSADSDKKKSEDKTEAMQQTVDAEDSESVEQKKEAIKTTVPSEKANKLTIDGDINSSNDKDEEKTPVKTELPESNAVEIQKVDKNDTAIKISESKDNSTKEQSSEAKSLDSKDVKEQQEVKLEPAKRNESTKKSTSEKDMIVVRNFTVSLDEMTQTVKMFQLVGWPYEGVPDSATPMLQLVQKSREHWKNTGFNSILLHTATGVKEEVSGVYCGACILLRMLQIEQEVDVVTTMERLRQQRPGMLRNKEFYMHLYKVLEKVVE